MTSSQSRLKQAKNKFIFTWIHTQWKLCQAAFQLSKVQIGSKSNMTNSWKGHTLRLQQTKISLAPGIPRQSAESWEDRAEKTQAKPVSYKLALFSEVLCCQLPLPLVKEHSAKRPLVWLSVLFLCSCILCSPPEPSESPIHSFDLDMQICVAQMCFIPTVELLSGFFSHTDRCGGSKLLPSQ